MSALRNYQPSGHNQDYYRQPQQSYAPQQNSYGQQNQNQNQWTAPLNEFPEYAIHCLCLSFFFSIELMIQSHSENKIDNNPGDSERGLAGALTGGLAGGFTGHKLNHGFLGSVGGAIIGSLIEYQLKKSGGRDHHQQQQQQQQLTGQVLNTLVQLMLLLRVFITVGSEVRF